MKIVLHDLKTMTDVEDCVTKLDDCSLSDEDCLTELDACVTVAEEFVS